MRRPHLTFAGMVVLIGCVGAPPPRPSASDPSSPVAPVGPPLAPLEAFRGGPQSLADPLLPGGTELEPSPPAEHEDHGGHEEHHGHEDHGA